MKYSIIITTRMRTQFLSDLIISLNNTIEDKANVEIHINYDNDDNQTRPMKAFFDKETPELKIYFHNRDRSVWMQRDYLNWCLHNFPIEGEFILNLNDDVIFLNYGWDRLAYDKLKEYLKDKPDGVVYARTEEHEKAKSYGGGLFSCFPIISKRAVDTLGFFFDNEYIAWNADIAMYQVYANIDRVLDLRGEVDMLHVSVHSGRRVADDINRGMKAVHKDGPDPDAFLNRDTQILLEYIDKCRRKDGA
jgi:hypothetical protein